MFSFFKKKPPSAEALPAAAATAPEPVAAEPGSPPVAEPERRSWLGRLRDRAEDFVTGGEPAAGEAWVPEPDPSPLPSLPPPTPRAPAAPPASLSRGSSLPPASPLTSFAPASPVPLAPPAPSASPLTGSSPARLSLPLDGLLPVLLAPPASPAPPDRVDPPAASKPESLWRRFSWSDPGPEVSDVADSPNAADAPHAPAVPPVDTSTLVDPLVDEPAADRRNWFDKLRGGLRKTGSSLAQVFTGTRIDEALYEELEAALLMADAGVRATEFLLDDLKRRVKEAKATDPAVVKALLADAVADLLQPLEKPLVVGEHVPTVMMVVGVNGAGKTTTIGKLTRHLAANQQKVLLAAADTFRAAAREQLAVWAGRNQVEIVSQEGGDPAAVTFDSVIAGKARGCDVVIADTAGRLTTQVHLMDELKKIRRVIGKAQAGAPHEVLLVVDGNTGQNALSQVQLFDAALGLTGLVITKLDGTAKGGVLAAIALWSRDRQAAGERAALPVYFIGVGEKLEDLQTFDAREFAHALLG